MKKQVWISACKKMSTLKWEKAKILSGKFFLRLLLDLFYKDLFTRPKEFTNGVSKPIHILTENSKTCSENAKKPKRFKLALGTEETPFNYVIIPDIIFLEPELHGRNQTFL